MIISFCIIEQIRKSEDFEEDSANRKEEESEGLGDGRNIEGREEMNEEEKQEQRPVRRGRKPGIINEIKNIQKTELQVKEERLRKQDARRPERIEARKHQANAVRHNYTIKFCTS